MTSAEGDICEILQAVPLAVVVADRLLQVVQWNRAAEVLYGHAAHEAVGASLVEVLFEEEDRASAAALFESVRKESPWEGDRRVRRKDGHLLVSSFRADRVGDEGLIWTATDGMDLGLAEQERHVLLSAEHAARRMSEEALGLVEAIITSAPVGIAVFDLTLRYVRVNDAYAELSGVDAEAHVGGRVGDVVPLPYDVGADLRRVVTTGRHILGRSVVLERPDLSTRYFTVSYYPVRTTAGVLIGAGATVIEVTEAKRLEGERAALLATAEDARRRLALLATASTVLTTTMDVDELLDRLAGVLTPGAGDWCIIQVRGRNDDMEHVAVSNHDPVAADQLRAFLRNNPIGAEAAGPISRVMASGVAQLVGPEGIDDALRASAEDRGRPEMASGFDVRSSVVVPIEARGHVEGVLVLSTDSSRTFDDSDLDLAVEIAHRAALALGNARAYQQEHQIAESLQRALLPATVSAVDGAHFAVRYLAATDGASVGGDWYDVMPFSDGSVGLVVGDVVGHDMAASSAMGQLRSVLRAFAYEDHRPGHTLTRLDRLFEPLGLSYATCVFGVLDLTSRIFRWSNAGHPPPLLIRGDRVEFLDGGASPLLGATGGAEVAEAGLDVQDGDLLVLYTDGLVERRTESLDEGLARLVRAGGLAGPRTAEDVCDRLLRALSPVGSERSDDVAILVAEVTSAPARQTHELELSSDPRSARLARRFAVDLLLANGWSDIADSAELLVSEIATNALRYGAPPFTLTAHLFDNHVEFGVTDHDTTLPTVATADATAESGRGLSLVRSLAMSWGTRRHAGAKTVWFCLEHPTAD